MLKRSFLAVLLSAAMVAGSMPAAAQTPALGQISGAANKSLAGKTAQLRNVNTGSVSGSMPVSATGEFSFTGVQFGQYVVEIVDQAGNVLASTSAMSLTATTATVTGVTAAATAATAGTLGGVIGSTVGFFSTTGGILTGAAIAGGLTAGVVAAKPTASGSN
jgi:hypothetical protein